MSITLKNANFHGWETLINPGARVYPYFSCALRTRITQKRATNIVVTGEPGVGKSYQTIDIVRVSEGLTLGGKDRFSLDQVVFRYPDFMKLTVSLAMGKCIVFDEPSYAMGKRDWFKEVNKALVQTIESKRFKVHPMFIPVINKALLDKTIRCFLIQFQIEVRDRGRATVYRIEPSQSSDKVYRKTFCQLEYRMLDWDLCDRDTCLDCDKLDPENSEDRCEIFRARYERKKALIQDTRYSQAAEMAEHAETKEMTNDQIAERLIDFKDLFTDQDGKIDCDLLRIVAKDKCQVVMGHTRGYTIVKLLKYKHPDVFH